MAATIAVTGATGEVGGRVAARLRDRGETPRLVVRDPARAPGGPAEVARASYEDGAAMREALAGVRTLFFVPASEAAERVAAHATVVEAAVAAGVERIVYLSFLAAAPDATFTFARDHHATEVMIRESGTTLVALRASLYQDLLPFWVGPGGAIRGPAGDGRIAWVARDDLADAAASVLAAPEAHDGRSYDLTGPEALSLGETAVELSGPLGRPVYYVPESLDEARAARRKASPETPGWEIEGWITSYAAIATGEMEVVSDAVERLSGHPPRRLAETFRDERIPLT